MKTHILSAFVLSLAVIALATTRSLGHAEFPTIPEKEIKYAEANGMLKFLDNYGYPTGPVYRSWKFKVTSVNMARYVFFTLHTREGAEKLFIRNSTVLKNSHFDHKRPTKIITHGWLNSQASPACTLIRNAYLHQDDYNVIVVDWSKITIGGYISATAHVKLVGKFVAEMIRFLVTWGMKLETTTLVGHSLGAHVMGIAGFYAKDKFTNSKVNYIVGLDPALPLFVFASPGTRISRYDAKYVEIIHTNAGFLGYLTAIGHADFFPNGGKKQLGCTVDIGGACSHARSYEFFAESIITNTGFYAKQCTNWWKYLTNKCKGNVALMGGLKKFLPYKGSFYLKTSTGYPFAQGKTRQ